MGVELFEFVESPPGVPGTPKEYAETPAQVGVSARRGWSTFDEPRTRSEEASGPLRRAESRCARPAGGLVFCDVGRPAVTSPEQIGFAFGLGQCSVGGRRNRTAQVNLFYREECHSGS